MLSLYLFGFVGFNGYSLPRLSTDRRERRGYPRREPAHE
jgi:hypothetical protein